MKDSGIEWIGEIPKEWTTSRLKYVLKEKMKYGATESGISYSDQLPRYIRITDISLDGKLKKDNMLSLPEKIASNYLLIDKTILFARSGATVGKTFLYHKEDGKAAFAGYLISACCNETKCIPEFLYYYTQSSAYDNWVKLVFSQATIQNIGADRYQGLIIPLTSIMEQQQIVSYLDACCSEIDATTEDIQKEINILDDYKKSVITEAVTKGLDPNVEMKDSGINWLPKIPAHWQVIPSKYLFANSDVRRKAGDEQLTASQKYGIITQKEYTAKENAQVVLATQGLEKWKHVEPNDFIISLRSFQGGLEMSEITGCITWHYVVLKAQKKVYHKYYKWLFKSAQYINALQGTCNFIRDGQDLRFSNFALVPLFEMPLSEQQEIAAYLDARCAEIDALIADKKKQLELLAEYKKSLIYEYVTGKKEVPLHE